MIEWTQSTSLHPFPSAAYLGIGYSLPEGDPQSQEVDSMNANFDPGFRNMSVIQLNSYTDTSSDKIWLIPNNTKAIRLSSSQCTFNPITSIDHGDTSYSDISFASIKWYNNQNSIDFINNSAFSATIDYSDDHKDVYDDNMTIVSSIGDCSVYLYSFKTNKSFIISDKFENAVYALPVTYNQQKYFNFLDIWGTHFTTDLSVGSRYSRSYLFDRNAWNEMNWNKYNITFVGNTEFHLATNSCSGCTQQQINDAHNYQQLSDSHRYRIVGGDPNNGLNNWLNTSIFKGMPIIYTLSPILDLLTITYFPKMNKNDIKQIHENMITALYKFASSPSCPGDETMYPCFNHAKDVLLASPLKPFSVTISSTPTALNCGTTAPNIVSCGIITALTGTNFDKFWSVYPVPQNVNSCFGSDKYGGKLVSTCTAATNDNDIVIKSGQIKNGVIQIICDSGSFVSGCGMKPSNPGTGAWDYNKAIIPYKTSCECQHKYNGICYAVCTPKINVADRQMNQFNGGWGQINCSKDSNGKYYSVLACGIELIGNQATILTPAFYASNYYQCKGYSQQPFKLYATCGYFKG